MLAFFSTNPTTTVSSYPSPLSFSFAYSSSVPFFSLASSSSPAPTFGATDSSIFGAATTLFATSSSSTMTMLFGGSNILCRVAFWWNALFHDNVIWCNALS
ncbi:hypothetical protein AAZX31_11G183900 [Glycine max]